MIAYYFAVLGLAPTASMEEIKKAYRQMAKQFHPDIVGNDPLSTSRFQEIQKAYEFLLAEKQRPSHYPPLYYPPYPPPYYPERKPVEEPIQSYTWSKVTAEPPKARPKAPPPPPVVPPPPEPSPPPLPTIPSQLQELAQLEACQEAVRRISSDNVPLLERLEEDITQYLKGDYQVQGTSGGFMVSSGKTGRKISVNLGGKHKQRLPFFPQDKNR